MKTKYPPKDVHQALGWVAEECGELIQAIGKAQRHGLTSYNPEIPEAARELNYDWILREMGDVRAAIDTLETFLLDGYCRSKDDVS